MKTIGWSRGLAALLCVGTSYAQPASTPEQIEFFETKIRPVLAENCYECHSHRAKRVEARLYLDSRVGVLAGGDNGPVIVVGNPGKSRLVAAIGYLDNDLQMPPRKKLPRDVVSDVAEWIKMGAPWPSDGRTGAEAVEPEAPRDWGRLRAEHWSFRPLAVAAIPRVGNRDRVRNPVDAFVLARLQDAGLEPNPAAERRVLIRRAYIDLIGLPPTPEQVAAFVDDDRPGAFARVVDALLASPHYGERWARHWLDVARYSDGDGGFLDRAALPDAWRYRDWVIGAFNEDLPYDQFVTQQLAGDLLGDPGPRVAGGFLAVGPTYTDDGGDPKAKAEARAETLNDRVDTVTRAFLALTVACARCHDHKFDPIPTSDYYAIGGIFGNTKLAQQPIVSRAEVEAHRKALAPLRAAEAALKTFISEQTKDYQDRVLRQDLPRYLIAAVSVMRSRLTGKGHDLRGFAGERKLSEAILSRFLQWFTRKPTRKNYPALKAYFDWIDANSSSYFVDDELREVAGKIQEDINDIFRARDAAHSEYRKSLAGGDKASPKPKDPVSFVRLDRDLRNQCKPNFGQSNMIELGPAMATRLTAMRETVSAENKRKPAPLPQAHFLVEAGSRDMAIAIRGDIRKPGKVTPRRFLHIIVGEDAPHFTKGSGRLELAAAIVAKSNPLTARVMVNRIWQHHFGRALVRTPSNFGKLGEEPTHPGLLDYLANEFMSRGWSIKAMHRLMMLSSTYRASSSYDEVNFLKDGDNRLNWRMNPRKMEAEAWRDSLLFVTGELDRTIGGKPEGGFFRSRRRTIYGKVSRNGDRHEFDRFLRLFDFPDARVSSAGRVESTVPQQYLFMMNSEFMISRGKALAKRLTVAARSDAARIELAYQLLFGRKPRAREKRSGLEFLAVEQQGRPNLERYLQTLLSTHEFMQIQ